MTPYRTLAPPAPDAKPRKPFRCRLGLHKMESFTFCDSKCFICQGMAVKFYCACGKLLGTKEVPTKRSVTITVSSDWDGMGGGGAVTRVESFIPNHDFIKQE